MPGLADSGNDVSLRQPDGFDIVRLKTSVNLGVERITSWDLDHAIHRCRWNHAWAVIRPRYSVRAKRHRMHRSVPGKPCPYQQQRISEVPACPRRGGHKLRPQHKVMFRSIGHSYAAHFQDRTFQCAGIHGRAPAQTHNESAESSSYEGELLAKPTVIGVLFDLRERFGGSAP